jgi:pimeloyl-ACP methyl ester carboxylesterase
VADLHCDHFGSGPPAIFVHGIFAWGLDTFPEQVALADDHHLLILDRRGFGQSPPASESAGWPIDVPDLITLLEEVGGAHLVGHSYGGVDCLLAAGQRPDLIQSLVVIEPNLLDLVTHEAGPAAVVARLRSLYRAAPGMTAAEFIARFAASTGRSPEATSAWIDSFGPTDWAAVETSRRERWPGDAPVDLGAIAAAGFPTGVVAGGWPPKGGQPPSAFGLALRAVSEAVALGVGAQLKVFGAAYHSPQTEDPEHFNAFLRDVWANAR